MGGLHGSGPHFIEMMVFGYKLDEKFPPYF